jgi:hypothetical protein
MRSADWNRDIYEGRLAVRAGGVLHGGGCRRDTGNRAGSIRLVVVIRGFPYEPSPHHLVERWHGFRDVSLTLCWGQAVKALVDHLLSDVIGARSGIQQPLCNRLFGQLVKAPIGTIFPAHNRTSEDPEIMIDVA